MLRAVFTATAALAIYSVPVWAQDLATPTGDVILTITGQIATTNVDDTAGLISRCSSALKTETIETTTIWTEGIKTFEGVSLAALVERFGIEGSELRATAINDYSVNIPLSDAVEGGPILAYRVDGNTMSVRDKGPLWVIYPYDSNSNYRTEVIYSRSIWQLDRLEAVE